MENLSLAQFTIPASNQLSEYFSSFYKLSSDQLSFYISFIFSIFQSISVHRQTLKGQELYSTLTNYLDHNQEYYKYLQTLLNLFKSGDLNSVVKTLEVLVITDGAITKLANLSWALIGMVTEYDLGSKNCLIYSKNSSVYEKLCEKLNISLAVFTAENLFYVKPVDGRIMLWVYEENYSNLILIVKEGINLEGYPFFYFENNKKTEYFEVAYEDLEVFGPEYNAFEKQVYFTGSPLGDYLSLIIALAKAIKLDANKEHSLMFYNKLHEALSQVTNNENERYFQYIIEFFWYFIKNQEIQIEQYMNSQKENLVWLAYGFKMLGEAFKMKSLEFPEYLEFFSSQFNLYIIVYQIQNYMLFNSENTEKTLNLYLSEVGKVYRCLVFKEVLGIKEEIKNIENNHEAIGEAHREASGDSIVESKIEPLKVFKNESLEAFQNLSKNFIKIKKSLLKISEIESLKSQIILFKEYLPEIPSLGILNPIKCETKQHLGLFFSLKCLHTYCIQCLFILITLNPQQNCKNCSQPISDKEKLKIYKKGFKINKIDYKNDIKPKPQPKREIIEIEPLVLVKCIKCNNDLDPSYFSIIQCTSNCPICVNCRFDEIGQCSKCQDIYSDEKKEVMAQLVNVRKTEKPQKLICDNCNIEYESKYFSKFCEKCKICVKCTVNTDKCPSCMVNVMPVNRICESCLKGFTIKDDIEIVCEYDHLYHKKCVVKGGNCYKCTGGKKKNNRRK